MRELVWMENLFNRGGNVDSILPISPVPCPSCNARGRWHGITCRGAGGPRFVMRCAACGYQSGRNLSTDTPASFAGAAYFIYYQCVGWKDDTALFLQ